MIHVMMKFFPSRFKLQSLYKFQTRYGIAQYTRGGGQLHCCIVIIHGSKIYFVVIPENQLKLFADIDFMTGGVRYYIIIFKIIGVFADFISHNQSNCVVVYIDIFIH